MRSYHRRTDRPKLLRCYNSEEVSPYIYCRAVLFFKPLRSVFLTHTESLYMICIFPKSDILLCDLNHREYGFTVFSLNIFVLCMRLCVRLLRTSIRRLRHDQAPDDTMLIAAFGKKLDLESPQCRNPTNNTILLFSESYLVVGGQVVSFRSIRQRELPVTVYVCTKSSTPQIAYVHTPPDFESIPFNGNRNKVKFAIVGHGTALARFAIGSIISRAPNGVDSKPVKPQ